MKYLTIPDFKKACGGVLSERTILTLLSRGDLIGFQSSENGKWLIPQKEVHAWGLRKIAAREQGAAK